VHRPCPGAVLEVAWGMVDTFPPKRPRAGADPLIGQRVGSYIVEQQLGEGGMGAVYCGVQPEIGKRVAIKFLSEQLNAVPELVARFFDEAKAVNLIGHENIVDIFDFGRTVDGRNFFVMELLDGPSLEERVVRDAALSPARAVDIGRQIAGALAAAHDRGIIHRDLKPENVFLVRRGGRDDFVKILDFGIAKLSPTGSGDDDKRRTKSGMILGTPGYMAPEQASGDTVDARTDVYALGVLLYRMLAGQMPFEAPTFAEILRRQLTEIPRPLGKVRADVDEALAVLVARLLARDPRARPQSMMEVAETLDEIARGPLGDGVVWYAAEPSGARPSPPSLVDEPPRRRRSPVAAIAGLSVAVALAAGLGVFALRSKRVPPPAASLTAPAPVPAPVPAPAPVPVPAAVPVPVPVPASGRFMLRVESDPPGAAISDGKKPLGTTPATLDLDAAGPLLLRLAGYREERLEAHRDDGILRAVLRPLPRPAPAAPRPRPLPHAPADAPRKKPGIGLDD
jgi:eukaryotic-like serine/threonine-protein kinase